MTKTNYSNFGTSVSNLLTEARTTQTALAGTANISQPYLNQMLTGKKSPSPEWVEIIANSMKLSKKKRRELHIAAAKDYGFKL